MDNKFFEYSTGAMDQNGFALPSSEALYGPYESIDAAWNAIEDLDFDLVPIGLTVGIKNGNNIVEYWLNGGVNKNNFVKKNLSTTDVNSAITTALGSYATTSDLNNKIYDLNYDDDNTDANKVILDWKYGNNGSAYLEIPAATAAKAGVLTATDKAKLDSLGVSGDDLLMVKKTQDQYDVMKAAGTTDSNTLYVIIG